MGKIRITRQTCTSYGTRDSDTQTQVILWIGLLETLNTTYPISDVMGADELGRSEFDDGCVVTTTRFEELVGGKWHEIEDPRVRPRAGQLDPGFLAAEAAIDAENRRRFPGDYLDCDCGDTRCHGECRDCQLCGRGRCDCYDNDASEEEDWCRRCENPYFVSEVTNQVCAACKDLVSCPGCGEWFEAQRLKEGLCHPCQHYLNPLMQCWHCRRPERSSSFGHNGLCTSCAELLSECGACQLWYQKHDLQDGLCATCNPADATGYEYYQQDTL